MAAYSNEEKRRLLQRIHWIFEMMGSFGLGLGFGTLFLGAIFTGRDVTKIRNLKMKMKKEVKKANEKDA